jgi:Ras-related C3 botulinum toxin substrate 1
MNRRRFARNLGLGALAAGFAARARAAEPAARNFKIVFVGDDGVGKSSLVISYTTGAFPADYVPAVFDNYNLDVKVDGRALNIGLWDTAGQDVYDRLRPLTYPRTDLFLICYDVANRDSLAHVESKWAPELRRHAAGVPFFVVGNKLDLRDDGAATVKTGEALALAEKIGAAGYHECSAKTRTGLPTLFGSAYRNLLSRPAA